MRHPGDQLLRDLQFWRIDEVVGRVDPKDRGRDGAEFRLRVIVAGSVEIIEKVIGIGTLYCGIDRGIYVILGLLSRREILLHLLPAQSRR